MKPCDVNSCEQVAAYEIREVGGRAKPHVLCMKHGLAKQAELSNALMPYQSTGIGPRAPSVEQQLQELKEQTEARRLAAPQDMSTRSRIVDSRQQPGPIKEAAPSSGATNELEMLREVQAKQREALERAAGELAAARELHAQLHTDLGLVQAQCHRAIADRNTALSDNAALRAELTAANERLKALQVQPLTGVDAGSNPDGPTTKPG